MEINYKKPTAINKILFQMPSTCEKFKGQLGERMQLGGHVMGHC